MPSVYAPKRLPFVDAECWKGSNASISCALWRKERDWRTRLPEARRHEACDARMCNDSRVKRESRVLILRIRYACGGASGLTLPVDMAPPFDMTEESTTFLLGSSKRKRCILDVYCSSGLYDDQASQVSLAASVLRTWE